MAAPKHPPEVRQGDRQVRQRLHPRVVGHGEALLGAAPCRPAARRTGPEKKKIKLCWRRRLPFFFLARGDVTLSAAKTHRKKRKTKKAGPSFLPPTSSDILLMPKPPTTRTCLQQTTGPYLLPSVPANQFGPPPQPPHPRTNEQSNSSTSSSFFSYIEWSYPWCPLASFCCLCTKPGTRTTTAACGIGTVFGYIRTVCTLTSYHKNSYISAHTVPAHTFTGFIRWIFSEIVL